MTFPHYLMLSWMNCYKTHYLGTYKPSGFVSWYIEVTQKTEPVSETFSWIKKKNKKNTHHHTQVPTPFKPSFICMDSHYSKTPPPSLFSFLVSLSPCIPASSYIPCVPSATASYITNPCWLWSGSLPVFPLSSKTLGWKRLWVNLPVAFLASLSLVPLIPCSPVFLLHILCSPYDCILLNHFRGIIRHPATLNCKP
jgi:hypothetical protein